MERNGKNNDPLAAPVSTMDDGLGKSSYNKTIDEGPGSTCQDSASDWIRWVSVESTVDAASSNLDWQWGATDSSLHCLDDATDAGNGRDPDGTFFWDPQATCLPAPESTYWPLGSSLLTSANG